MNICRDLFYTIFCCLLLNPVLLSQYLKFINYGYRYIALETHMHWVLTIKSEIYLEAIKKNRKKALRNTKSKMCTCLPFQETDCVFRYLLFQKSHRAHHLKTMYCEKSFPPDVNDWRRIISLLPWRPWGSAWLNREAIWYSERG